MLPDVRNVWDCSFQQHRTVSQPRWAGASDAVALYTCAHLEHLPASLSLKLFTIKH